MLDNLLEALSSSPNNIPLKYQIALLYFDNLDFKNAEKHIKEILELDNTHKNSKFLLAKVYFRLSKYSPCEIILEELLAEQKIIPYLELLCHCQLAKNQFSEAKDSYIEIQNIDDSYKNDEFDKALKASLIEDENFVDNDGFFLQKPKINFEDVGGMDGVKNEIDLKIIKPLKHRDLYKAYGKKIGGGILLYGPPGCGKTYLARATAGQIEASFINVGINDILDIWIGSSERNLHEIFETARRNRPCVIFIDEIDALGANRNDIQQSAGRTVINQFLSELDGIDSDNDGILVIGATNAPWYLDPAFRRPGRFDRIIFVSPPDRVSREAIFTVQLKNKPTENIDVSQFAKKSKEFSGADIQAAIDYAIEEKMQTAFADGIPKPLNTKDILRGISKVKPSTKEWFGSAKNYALYSNDSGLYDEILTYLNIKK